MLGFKNDNLDKKIVDNIRALAIDAIALAGSGHSGIALGASPIIYSLFNYHLRIDRNKPNWFNRDRFIISAGHGSALLYSTLVMAGLMDLEDLKEFRKIDSRSPGHPELGEFVEMTTGPLGQGLASSVGIALGEEYLRNYFGKDVVNFHSYCLCSDGDLAEGVSYEALSLAGHLKLNKLIVLYDSNDITLDNKLEASFSENIKTRFEAINWNYLLVSDGENIESINKAIEEAKLSDKPTIIEIKTIIGKYSKLEGTNKVHGIALDEEDISSIKAKLDLRDLPFVPSADAMNSFKEDIDARVKDLYLKWEANLDKLDIKKRKELDLFINKDKAIKINEFDNYEKTEEEALRQSSGKVLAAIAEKLAVLMGGSADLSVSTFAKLNTDDFSANNRLGRNINFGVREHAMAAIANGMALLGFTPFVSTFLAFSDYLKPSLRLSALMNLPVIYIFTHDSISLGSDGPTHQPIEQLVSLRATPGLDLYRPADLNEILGTYRSIFERRKPSAIVLSRNKVKTKEDTKVLEVKRGAYVVQKEIDKLDAIIVSSGEDFSLAREVYENLVEKDYGVRLVSMPSMELFEEQDQDYKDSVIDKDKTFVIEASSSYSWYKYVNDEKRLFTIDQFGASGDKDEVLKKFNFTSDYIIKSIEKML